MRRDVRQVYSESLAYVIDNVYATATAVVTFTCSQRKEDALALAKNLILRRLNVDLPQGALRQFHGSHNPRVPDFLPST